MTDIKLPAAVVEAAARALAKQRLDADVWDEVLDRNMKHFYTHDATAALLAGLKAWPDSILMPVELILPLTEKQNAEA